MKPSGCGGENYLSSRLTYFLRLFVESQVTPNLHLSSYDAEGGIAQSSGVFCQGIA